MRLREGSQVAVYCIAEIISEHPLRFDLFKIGVSSNPQARLKELQTGNPRPLAFIIINWFRDRADALRVEREAHEHMAEHGRLGEWFSYDEGNGGCPFEAIAIAASFTSYIPASESYYDVVPGPGCVYSLLRSPVFYPDGRGGLQ